tara:strand:+ start:88 stop:372 length:285 start_codon:yes stop_codon:yes gene_type:complete
MTEHNKYYWEVGRNGYVANDTDNINEKIPKYYIGKYHKYEARKVVEDFELTYNLGTAVTYLLRANRKHNTPIECIKKAIAHLEFELEKLEKWNS